MTMPENDRRQPDPVDGSASSPTVAHRVVTLLGLVGRHEGGIGAREAERVTGIDRSAAGSSVSSRAWDG
jgi:hypothetical protein